MTYFELSKGAAALTFQPHWKPDTATFDVTTADSLCVAEHMVPPDFTRSGTGICSNIDRATARRLRDALTAWLEGREV